MSRADEQIALSTWEGRALAAERRIKAAERFIVAARRMIDEGTIMADKEVIAELLAALEEIDIHAKVRTAVDTNVKTIWAIRKMARAALARAQP